MTPDVELKRYIPARLFDLDDVKWDPSTLEFVRAECASLRLSTNEIPCLLHTYIWQSVQQMHKDIDRLEFSLKSLSSLNSLPAWKRASFAIDDNDYKLVDDAFGRLMTVMKVNLKLADKTRDNIPQIVQKFIREEMRRRAIR